MIKPTRDIPNSVLSRLIERGVDVSKITTVSQVTNTGTLVFTYYDELRLEYPSIVFITDPDIKGKFALVSNDNPSADDYLGFTKTETGFIPTMDIDPATNTLNFKRYSPDGCYLGCYYSNIEVSNA